MKRRFLEKFFPASITTSIRKETCGIRLQLGETLYEYWERFNKLCALCPRHQISEQLLIQYFYEEIILMDRSMIDAVSGGAFMDKTPIATIQLISNMVANYQQFGTRVATPSRVVASEISISMVADNQRLENKLTELTSLIRQLAIGQQQNVMAANQPRLYGICCAPNHPIDACSILQETKQVDDVSIMQPRQLFRPQQQQYNPYSNTYNLGGRDHLNLRYGPGPQQQHTQ